MTSFAFATAILSVTVLLLARPVASSTEYKCSGGEHCKLSSTDDMSMCTPIGEGLPDGNTFMPTLMGSGASTPMPYACIGLSDTDLVEGGGGCVVTCPDSCTVTSNVVSPCSGGDGHADHGDEDHDEFFDDEATTSGAKDVAPIALASMTGVVAVAMLL
eukprot:CAMPEP_0197733716 /NCGR_PEP_ID=MMETSP1434-20131217/44051_1 /TAXON_ID=265543 /ORGANISM="Minutocellus polymorphus, Strain CCMP3303" /LENGTH=158 /DNA_ID=CAMNT_0043321107 /DNA_START=98 /DNA_END=574 /DNA_ORIENTATION=-